MEKMKRESIHILDDCYLEEVVESIKKIDNSSIRLYRTPEYDVVPGKETIRSELFNYSIVLYGKETKEGLQGLLYFQLPSIFTTSRSMILLWTSCKGMDEKEFQKFFVTVEELIGSSKIQVNLGTKSSEYKSIKEQLIELGFRKEVCIVNGYGENNDKEIYSKIVN